MQEIASGGFLFYVFECDIANGRGKAPGLFQALKLNKLAGDNNSHPPCYSAGVESLEVRYKISVGRVVRIKTIISGQVSEIVQLVRK